MHKRVNPTAIGAFVVGAVALAVVSVIVLGKGMLFGESQEFVCMFPGDLNGLQVGAPVKFRGVQIGTVEAIRLSLTSSEGLLRPELRHLTAKRLRLPVIISIDPQMLSQRGGTGQELTIQGFENVVQAGLRAQLSMESVLTGRLYVNLDIQPGTAVNLALVPGGGRLREIPTEPTKFEAVQEKVFAALAKFDELDLNSMVASISDAGKSFAKLSSSPELREAILSFKETSGNMNRAVLAVRQATMNADARTGPLIEALEKSSADANLTMEKLRIVLADIDSTLNPESPLSIHLNAALVQLTETSRSVEELSDFLERNPSSIIRGKYFPKQAHDGQRSLGETE